MSSESYPVLAAVDGQAINIATMEEAVAAPIAAARAGQGFTFFTLNLDHIVKRRDDPAFRAAYEAATFVSADGAPVALLARRGHPAIRRTTGADLVEPLAAEAAREGVPIGLFGSTAETLALAAQHLAEIAPGLVIAHREAPPMGFDPTSPAAEEAATRLADSGARIVLVALGAPKQELFSAHARQRHPQLGLVCIGAALDFLAGTEKRAPSLMQASGLEWLWRLSANPRRLGRRYAHCARILAELAISPRAPAPRT